MYDELDACIMLFHEILSY